MSASPHSRQAIVASAMVESVYRKAAPARQRGGDQARWLQLQGDTSLARIVARCRPNSRCCSPGCIQCRAAEQALIAKTTKKFVRVHIVECEVAFVSIVPLRSKVPLGQLVAFDVDKFARRIRDGLAKTDVQWGVGAIDLTVNAHGEGAFDPFWQPHAALMAGAKSLDDLKSQLRAAFSSDDLTPRPVLVKQWDGRAAVFPYLHKPNFERRITIEAQQRHNAITGHWRTCRGTTNDRLRASENLEVTRFLDRIGLGGRLLLRNLRLRGKDGRIWLE
jgi:hypothetical protein